MTHSHSEEPPSSTQQHPEPPRSSCRGRPPTVGAAHRGCRPPGPGRPPPAAAAPPTSTLHVAGLSSKSQRKRERTGTPHHRKRWPESHEACAGSATPHACTCSRAHTHKCTPDMLTHPYVHTTPCAHTHVQTDTHSQEHTNTCTHRTRCSHTHMHTHTHKCAHGMLARPRAHWHTSHARAHSHTFPPSPWPETPRSPPGMGRADVCPAPRPLSAARRQRRPDSRGRRAALRFTEREAAAGSPALSYLWQK